MAKLRRDGPVDNSNNPPARRRPLRILAAGTLFLTHTLSLPFHPAPDSVTRAHSVHKSRGGSASTLLSLLAQFSNVDALLVASLAGNDEGKAILRDLDREGVSTRFCKVWDNYGVPSAWVLHAGDTDSHTVINHNPLPDITHEEFISLLGPLLAPENYYYPSPSVSPTLTSLASPPTNTVNNTNPNVVFPSSSGLTAPNVPRTTNSPAPFDWIHVEGRSVKTTLSNIIGLDGLARERKWRTHCVFSVDVGRKGRQGVEALIPHADVLFLNKHYAKAHSPHYATTPRAFLLSFTHLAPPHALLVAHWGTEGAAVLSLPTREYFQSSGWVEEPGSASLNEGGGNDGDTGEGTREVAESVRSGSSYWAGPSGTRRKGQIGSSTESFTAEDGNESSHGHRGRGRNGDDNELDNDNDSQGTETPGDNEDGVEGDGGAGNEEVLDEAGAQDAFVAGMIYALSRKIMPGAPYTPSAAAANESSAGRRSSAAGVGTVGESGGGGLGIADDRQRWRLDECLRFATELAGRKARRRNWEGLADEMTRAGWFE